MEVETRQVWDYEQLSIDAKQAGGPEPFRKALAGVGYELGFAEGLGRGRIQGAVATLAVGALTALVVKEGPRAVRWARGKVAKLRGRAAAAERGVPDEDDRTTSEG